MSQEHLEEFSKSNKHSQNNNEKDSATQDEDKVLSENETEEELLSTQELADIAGGANEDLNRFGHQEVVYRPSPGSNPFETSTTFPIPPHSGEAQ